MKQARRLLLCVLLLHPPITVAGDSIIRADDTGTSDNPLPAPGEECE
ncbi:MAG: hypothetical protein R3308_04200 [Thiohalobacterales bacterium]|nr:hypothetical protein [Thiohalobacterales bacterium]